jgi:phospholipid-binding lipoprotein MlaA
MANTNNYAKMLNILPILILTGFLSGCASLEQVYVDPVDPFEPYNRFMHETNDDLDRAVLKPLAEMYEEQVSPGFNQGVNHFFGNLADLKSSLNNVLQLKFKNAYDDLRRVAINTTLGIGGIRDVASSWGIAKHGEDFGQTLGYWGLDPGPYIRWPLLGPSNLRDSVGMVGDWYTNPISYMDDEYAISLSLLEMVDLRADLLNASRLLETAALDPYIFVRDAYLQQRRYKVYDGNPPEQFDFFD